MNVGILTLPLQNNYGGILQAYALISVLKQLGHNVWLIDFPHHKIPKWKYPLVVTKRLVKKHILKKDTVIFLEAKQQYEDSEIRKFISQHIQPQTKTISTTAELRNAVKKYALNALLVGSDQVWREKYVGHHIKNYFLEFTSNTNVKRISYAASFGVDSWQYSNKLTKELEALARKFDAISVREESSLQLCSQFLKTSAHFHLDPTLLLPKHFYLQLIENKNKTTFGGDLMVYILDYSADKSMMVDQLGKTNNLTPFYIGTKNTTDHKKHSVEHWIEGFSHAKFVITDSFHGCIFSILFNIPFLAIGNESRGLARFTSLLRLFSLENRLVIPDNKIFDTQLPDPPDWEKVNYILKEKREVSLSFLKESLT
jgi:hypothetical protein